MRSRSASAESATRRRRQLDLADEAASAAATPRLDEAGRAEHRERLAQRHGRDLEAGGQLGLGRQLGAGLEDAGADRLADPADDLLDGALGTRRPEGDLDREGGADDRRDELERHML